MTQTRKVLGLPSLIVIYIILGLAALSCLLPVMHILALSFSSKAATLAGRVNLLPVDFSYYSYQVLFASDQFIRSMFISFIRIALGVPINLMLCFLAAYPLSLNNKRFRARTAYVWFFVLTMLFSGGLIPTYLLISELGLIDSIWSLVLPGAVNVFFIILLLNFFRNLPAEMSESAFVDGANHFQVLLRIYLPTSIPSIATILLFSMVGHWNSWFDGIIYMNNPLNYPLQSYLKVIITGLSQLMNVQVMSLFSIEILDKISNKTITSAQIFVGMVPIIIVYPFLQRYFIKGITIGSVKG